MKRQRECQPLALRLSADLPRANMQWDNKINKDSSFT